MNVHDFLERLTKVKPAGNHRWRACCPAHDDSNPSLSVSVGDDGRILLKCHKGCSVEGIVAAIGITLRDLMPEQRTPSAPRPPKSAPKGHETSEAAVAAARRSLGGGGQDWSEPTASIYRSTDGRELMRVLRFDRKDGKGKTYRPIHIRDGRWQIGDPPGPLPLYRLDQLSGDGLVVVVEGEGCADAAAALGFVATTSAHGAKSAAKTDWSFLAGRDVAVLPDNDDAGAGYAKDVATILAGLTPPARTRIVTLPGLGEGEDIVEFSVAGRAAGLTPEGVRAAIEALVDAEEPLPVRRAQVEERKPTNPITLVPFTPLPLDALPPLACEFVQQSAASIGCDPSYIALPMLAGSASLIGNSWRIELKTTWTEPSIIPAMIVGESGTSKSPAVEAALRSIRRLESIEGERYAAAAKEHRRARAEYEKRLSTWKRAKNDAGPPPEECEAPRITRYTCGDTTVEAIALLLRDRWRGILLARDELSGWLTSFNQYRGGAGGDVPFWLEALGGRPYTVDRKTGADRYIHIARASVSIAGGIQPRALAAAIGRARFEDGLMARLIFAYPPRKPARWTEATVDPRLLELYDEAQFKLAELLPGGTAENPEPNLLRLSPGAKRLWIDFHNENADQQATLEGDLAAAWSKLTGYGARFALVTHLMRIAEDDQSADRSCVDLRSMQCGIALSRWAANEAERVYAALAEDDDVRAVRQRVEVIERDFGGAVTPRDWHKRNNRRTPEEARRELEEIVEAGLAAWRPRDGGTKGGRPTEECALVAKARRERDRVEVSGAGGPSNRPSQPGGVLGCGFRGAEGDLNVNGLLGGENGVRESGRGHPGGDVHPETPSRDAPQESAADRPHPATRNPETTTTEGPAGGGGEAREPATDDQGSLWDELKDGNDDPARGTGGAPWDH